MKPSGCKEHVRNCGREKIVEKIYIDCQKVEREAISESEKRRVRCQKFEKKDKAILLTWCMESADDFLV